MSWKKHSVAVILILLSVSMFTEAKDPKVIKCKKRSEFCTAIYKPVCGYKPDIRCITTPCNYITYSNACEACRDENVESYTEGPCKEPEPPIEPKVTKCTKESRKGEFCPAVYRPVCGYKPDIMCINPPCNYVTYGNSCEACHDKDVESYTEGECTQNQPVDPEPEPLPVVTKCTKKDRKGDACFDIYQPVCGYKPDIVCITTPCNYITYANSCEACHDEDVESYTQGECPEDPDEPVILECDPPKEPEVIKCTEESRQGDACPAVYRPVCGYKPDIMCIRPPCNYITYGNSCEACHDKYVESYTEGECTQDQPIIIPEPEPLPVVTKCTKKDREGDFCPEIYSPVCGYKPDIVCITTPCNYITYPNACFACHDEDVESYTPGECPKEPKEPEVIKCTEESRKGEFCPAVYSPVCGYRPDIMCINPPCNYVTYGNSCEACHDKYVESYTPGECIQDQPVEIPEPEPVPIVTKCTKKDRKGDACFDIYQPVCGYKPDIVCITTPCNYITYANSCEACHDEDVESYTQGECVYDTPVSDSVKSGKSSKNSKSNKQAKKKSVKFLGKKSR